MNFIFHIIYGMSSTNHWRTPSFFKMFFSPPTSYKWWLYLGLVHLFTGSPKKGDWEPSTSDSLDDPNGDHPHGEFLFGDVSVGPGSIYNIGMEIYTQINIYIYMVCNMYVSFHTNNSLSSGSFVMSKWMQRLYLFVKGRPKNSRTRTSIQTQLQVRGHIDHSIMIDYVYMYTHIYI